MFELLRKMPWILSLIPPPIQKHLLALVNRRIAEIERQIEDMDREARSLTTVLERQLQRKDAGT